MPKVRHIFRSQAPKPSVSKPSMMKLPPEIRLNIYLYVVNGKTLLHTAPKVFRGLYMSCQKIKAEMDAEFVRVAPTIFLDIFADVETVGPEIHRPTRTQLVSFSHLSIGLQRDMLNDLGWQARALEKLLPLTSLHFASLTISIGEYGSDGRDEDPEKYKRETAYSDVISFATRCQCLLLPALCAGNHHRARNRFCLAGLGVPSSDFNVRSLSLKFKKLGPETSYDTDVYYLASPDKPGPLRWCPSQERSLLRKFGWDVYTVWDNTVSPRVPSEFIWLRYDKGKCMRELHGLRYDLVRRYEAFWLRF